MGKFTDYKVPLKSLAQGTHLFEYHLGKRFFEDMESPDIRDADLDVKLTVTCKGDTYILDFHIAGTFTLICDRCLDNLVMPVDTDYQINVEYGDDYNDESDDVLVIPYSDNYLNVAYMLYDTVALSIPMKHVHPAGKCNRQMSQVLKKHGARPDDELEDELIDEIDDIGADAAPDRPVDSRWDALKGLVIDDHKPDND